MLANGERYRFRATRPPQPRGEQSAVGSFMYPTIEWPGEVDLYPDVLRGDEKPASGAEIPRRVVQAA